MEGPVVAESIGPLRTTKSDAVAELIRSLIHDGRLAEGAAVPSTRALATELGVSRGTVVTAYEQLDGEGYLTLRHGSRARVAAPLALVPPSAAPRPPDAEATTGLVDMSVGQPSLGIDEREWRAAWRHATAHPPRDALPSRLGDSDLRAQIAAQLALRRGFATAPHRVIVTAGTVDAVSLIAETLAPGRIAVENPGYRSGVRAIASAGASCVPVPVDERGLDLDALRRTHARSPLAAVMVTPSHQFPMGAVMPVGRRLELLAWAAEHDVVVIEDDYDSEFRHIGAPLPALAAIDTAGSVVHLGSFSKILTPHLRCGYLVLPGPDTDVGRRIAATREARGAAVASPVQAAIAHLLSSGALRRHIARCRRDYAHRRALVHRTLAGVDGIRVGALGGGLHVVVEFDAVPAKDVAGNLRERGFVVSLLQDYVLPRSGLQLNGIALSYGNVGIPALETVLAALVREIA